MRHRDKIHITLIYIQIQRKCQGYNRQNKIRRKYMNISTAYLIMSLFLVCTSAAGRGGCWLGLGLLGGGHGGRPAPALLGGAHQDPGRGHLLANQTSVLCSMDQSEASITCWLLLPPPAASLPGLIRMSSLSGLPPCARTSPGPGTCSCRPEAPRGDTCSTII